MNKVMLIGNLGKDPEIRTMQNGNKVASFSIATSERWKDKSGEKQERTEWHNIVVFNDHLVTLVDQYVSKGSKLFIEGQLQTRKYTKQNGEERTVTEIVLQKYKGAIEILSGFEKPNDEYHPSDDADPPF